MLGSERNARPLLGCRGGGQRIFALARERVLALAAGLGPGVWGVELQVINIAGSRLCYCAGAARRAVQANEKAAAQRAARAQPMQLHKPW